MEFLHTYAGIWVLLIGSVVVSVGGLLVVRKIYHFEKLKPSHDVGGFLLSVVAVLYAVLVGLIVVDALQQYNHARDIAETETNSLADLFMLAKGLSEPMRSDVRDMCNAYAGQVIETEWSMMNQGTYCSIARGKAIHLMQSLIDFEPKTEREKALYPTMVQEASQFWQNRQERLSIAEKGLPPVEWAVLITGGIITVLFTYFFGMENAKLQIMMTAMVALLVAMNLALLLLFSTPFKGSLAVQHDAFTELQSIFKDLNSD